MCLQPDPPPCQAIAIPSSTEPESPSEAAVRPDPPDLHQVTYLKRQHFTVHWKQIYHPQQCSGIGIFSL